MVNCHRLAGPDGEGLRTLDKLIWSCLGPWIDRQRAERDAGTEGADARLAHAEHLRAELVKILEGAPPYDLFARWKPLHEQPVGWEPDMNDGVRVNIRPFMAARPLGARAKNACILRTTPNIHWRKDRGKEPSREKVDYPWFWSRNPENPAHKIDFPGGADFDGNRWNDPALHSCRQGGRACAGGGRERPMTFKRQPTDKWRDEVPGARWFKADLHVHTIDDHLGGAKMPSGLSGDPADLQTLTRYARRFLQAVVERDVQVVDLKPHSPRTGSSPETSAVWRIVEEWNEGKHDDGVPFREKVYAVFPGFEPSLRDGKEGLPLLFLFDPEIGRERYLRAFDLVMGGVSPWRDGGLRISGRYADDAFNELKNFRERECPVGEDGNSLVLAPHIDADKGLLHTQKAQVLQLFGHGAITDLELDDEKLPEETLRNRPWLCKGMETHRHAFVASDSRVRIGFERVAGGAPREIDNPPDVQLNAPPWLKEVTVSGGASIFGGMEDGEPRKTRFRFSSDLTCIVGGSMIGKSSLLDGLRVHTGAPLPRDMATRGQVEARGRNVFGSGTPDIELDCPGMASVAPFDERWPEQFFAQTPAPSRNPQCVTPSCALWMAGRKRSVFDSVNTDSEARRWNGRTYCNA